MCAPAFLAESEGRKWVAKPLDQRLMSPQVVVRMEQEAEILGESPRLPGCTTPKIEAIDHQQFILRPFLVGRTLQEGLSIGRLAPPKALRLVERLLAALGGLHHLGVLHRNIKPTNIVLTSDPERPVVLVDMGWDDGAVANSSLSSRRPAVNSYAFLAPEQSGALDYEVGEWTDLYSVGAVLFECLTGRRLIQAEDVGSALRRHMTIRVPSLSNLGVKAPRLVDEFMHRLLSKDPRQRYQSTHGAGPMHWRWSRRRSAATKTGAWCWDWRIAVRPWPTLRSWAVSVK